jgi:acyl-coenzyme A thioesterase PaaI-like protein
MARSDIATTPASTKQGARPPRFSVVGKAVRRRPKLLNFWGPFLGAGIRVVEATPDWRYVRVELRQHWWNTNLVGTAFGGALFSMCDPFYMVMLLANVGRDYVVWDRGATIHFRRPGRGTVQAEFRLTEEQIAAVCAAADRDGRHDATFTVSVTDAEGNTVADVEKVVYLRSKKSTASQPPRAVDSPRAPVAQPDRAADF